MIFALLSVITKQDNDDDQDDGKITRM